MNKADNDAQERQVCEGDKQQNHGDDYVDEVYTYTLLFVSCMFVKCN